jgi:hypothetical protein
MNSEALHAIRERGARVGDHTSVKVAGRPSLAAQS